MLQFNTPTTHNGIIQRIERDCGFNPGDISGNAVRLAQFTSDINSAGNEVFDALISSSGRWQIDDTNHTDLPFMYTDLVAGQRDYSFLTDGSGNMVLDIYKVMVKGSNGIYYEVDPVDVQTDINMQGFYSGQDFQGQPRRYDKTGNSILLDAIPSYSSADGLKIFYNRTPYQFLVSDTTKKPGIPGLYHELYVLIPSYAFARGKQLANRETLFRDKELLFGKMKVNARDRNRDEQSVIEPEYINSK